MRNSGEMIPMIAAWIAAAILLTCSGLAHANFADAAAALVEGRWLTDDRKAIVTISRCGERVCGKISKVLDTAPGVPRTDVNNPAAGLRSRPITGMPVLTGFKHACRYTRGRSGTIDCPQLIELTPPGRISWQTRKRLQNRT